jgi:hypothetical protein
MGIDDPWPGFEDEATEWAASDDGVSPFCRLQALERWREGLRDRAGFDYEILGDELSVMPVPRVEGLPPEYGATLRAILHALPQCRGDQSSDCSFFPQCPTGVRRSWL